MKQAPHLKLTPPQVPPRVIVCGDPARAEAISRHLSESNSLIMNREYHSYAGNYDGKPILVTSHGVGSAGAAICFQELIHLGAKIIIRVGTAGALYDESRIGDLVVPVAAVRKDGVSLQMMPAEFPAIANAELTQSLVQEAQRSSSVPLRSGIILTSDLFYPGLLDNQFEFYHRANIIAVEMECSTLFVIAHLNRIKAASILAIDGNPLRWKTGDYDPHSNQITEAMNVAIESSLKAITKAAIPTDATETT